MIQSYPWYIADWRNSETRLSLTLAQRGLYRELLDYCYLEGSLPADRRALLQIAGCSVNAESEHSGGIAEAQAEHSLRTGRARVGHDLSTVLALFKYNDSTDRYHHPKVDEVMRKLLSYHEQKKHAGIKSGKARRERALNSRSTAAEPSPTPTPSPSPSYINARVNAADLNGSTSQKFPQWFEIWESVRGNAHRDKAASYYLSVVTTEMEADALACVRSYCEGPGSDPAHGYRPDNFLREMAGEKFKARWPPAAQIHRKQASGFVESVTRVMAKRIANGEKPLL